MKTLMVPFEKQKRFRVNPIEIAIFSVISLIFVKSGYSLLYARQGFEPEVLTVSAQDPLGTAGSPISNLNGRMPASVGPSAPVAKTFSELKIGCEPDQRTADVSANKIRLIGNLCSGASVGAPDESAQDVKKVNVVNTSAKVAATVFPDYSNLRFSTDYIALAQGTNLITVEYEFKDGKVLGRQFSVNKN